MRQPVRNVMAVVIPLVLLVSSACKLTPAVPNDLPYNRATGWGQYLNPDQTNVATKARVLTPTATNISYAPAGSTNADMKFDLYIPGSPASNGPRPLVIWFHGGGGTKDVGEIAPAIRELYDRGFVIVSANYSENVVGRGLPTATMVTQGKRLVRLLKLSAAVNGSASPFSGSRIFVSGVSAGAYLSSMIGLTPGRFEPTDADVASQTSAVAGVVGLLTPYDLPQMMNWANANVSNNAVRGEVGVIENAANTWFGCRLPARPVTLLTMFLPTCDSVTKMAEVRSLSPSTYVATSNPNTPFFLVTGTKDLIVQSVPQGQAFSDALTARNAAANMSDASAWTDLVGATHAAMLGAPVYPTATKPGQFVAGSPLSSIPMVTFLGFLGCSPNSTSTGMICLA